MVARCIRLTQVVRKWLKGSGLHLFHGADIANPQQMNGAEKLIVVPVCRHNWQQAAKTHRFGHGTLVQHVRSNAAPSTDSLMRRHLSGLAASTPVLAAVRNHPLDDCQNHEHGVIVPRWYAAFRYLMTFRLIPGNGLRRHRHIAGDCCPPVKPRKTVCARYQGICRRSWQ